MKGQEDITSTLANSVFLWTRTSTNVEADEIWNQAHTGVGPIVEITHEDVDSQATFSCSINL